MQSVQLQKDRCNISNDLFTIFENNVDCVNVIYKRYENSSKFCALKFLNENRIASVYTIGWEQMVSRNISNNRKRISTCNFYIFIAETTSSIKELLTYEREDKRCQRFYPLSSILIINNTTTSHLKFDEKQMQYITRNGLIVSWVNSGVDYTNPFEYHRVLQNDTIIIKNFSAKLFNRDEVIDNLLKNKNGYMNLRVSLFNCPPFIIYMPPKSTHPTSYRGIEMQIISEISKNWPREYVMRDFFRLANVTTDPWNRVLMDVRENISDIASCSIWLSRVHAEMTELSKYYEYQCATFLVPRPEILSRPSTIYKPLTNIVWISFTICLFLTTLLLKLIAILGARLFESDFRDNKFNDLTTGLIEVVNIATSHGIPNFPWTSAVKILICSWTIFTLLIGTGYTTGYTSLLTIPYVSKPIDSIRDFIEAGITFGEQQDYSVFKKELRESENPDLVELANRMTIETSIEHRRMNVKTKKYACMIQRLKNFISPIKGISDLTDYLRVMKGCLHNYYTGFGFNFHSIYTYIFDREISRLLESGIITIWFENLNTEYTKTNMSQFFDSYTIAKREPQQLTTANLVGVFYFYATGVISSIIVFVFELLRNMSRRFNRRRM